MRVAKEPTGGPPSPPIVRNLTSLFVRYRHSRRVGQTRFGAGNDDKTGHRLLDLETGATPMEMSEMSLSPPWTDAVTAAQEELKNIREKLVQLEKAQQKRLLKVFVDDAAPDKEVESISNQLSTLVRRCEQHIHQVKTRGGADRSKREAETRQNAQRNLATQLQQMSQQFRQSQKDYAKEIRGRQHHGLWDDGPGQGGFGGGGGDDFEVGFNDEQTRELDSMEINAGQRSAEITQIATSISDLHTVFKELAVLVIDQGSILDRIDYNIEAVVEQTFEANKQLKKAEDSQKSNRAMKCIMILVTIDLILIILLIIKARN